MPIPADRLQDPIGLLEQRLFTAVEEGDLKVVRECYHPDAVVHNHAFGTTANRDEMLEVVSALAASVTGFRYEEVTTHRTENGFVREHLVTGTTGSGAQFAVPVCCVVDVVDGQIWRINEYADSRRLETIGL